MATAMRASLVCTGLTWLVVAALAALDEAPKAAVKGPRASPADVRVALAFDVVAARPEIPAAAVEYLIERP